MISPILDLDGLVVGASKIERDVTEIRRARERQQVLLRGDEAPRDESLRSWESYVRPFGCDIAGSRRLPLRAARSTGARGSSKAQTAGPVMTTPQPLIKAIAPPFDQLFGWAGSAHFNLGNRPTRFPLRAFEPRPSVPAVRFGSRGERFAAGGFGYWPFMRVNSRARMARPGGNLQEEGNLPDGAAFGSATAVRSRRGFLQMTGAGLVAASAGAAPAHPRIQANPGTRKPSAASPLSPRHSVRRS
jgi:hypothetical protein